jgi:hypothetical protein
MGNCESINGRLSQNKENKSVVSKAITDFLKQDRPNIQLTEPEKENYTRDEITPSYINDKLRDKHIVELGINILSHFNNREISQMNNLNILFSQLFPNINEDNNQQEEDNTTLNKSDNMRWFNKVFEKYNSFLKIEGSDKIGSDKLNRYHFTGNSISLASHKDLFAFSNGSAMEIDSSHDIKGTQAFIVENISSTDNVLLTKKKSKLSATEKDTKKHASKRKLLKSSSGILNLIDEVEYFPKILPVPNSRPKSFGKTFQNKTKLKHVKEYTEKIRRKILSTQKYQNKNPNSMIKVEYIKEDKYNTNNFNKSRTVRKKKQDNGFGFGGDKFNIEIKDMLSGSKGKTQKKAKSKPLKSNAFKHLYDKNYVQNYYNDDIFNTNQFLEEIENLIHINDSTTIDTYKRHQDLLKKKKTQSHSSQMAPNRKRVGYTPMFNLNQRTIGSDEIYKNYFHYDLSSPFSMNSENKDERENNHTLPQREPTPKNYEISKLRSKPLLDLEKKDSNISNVSKVKRKNNFQRKEASKFFVYLENFSVEDEEEENSYENELNLKGLKSLLRKKPFLKPKTQERISNSFKDF